MSNFAPLGVATVNVAATTTTGSVALNLPSAPMAVDVRLYNSGLVLVRVAFGTSGIEATATSMPLAPGSVEVFSLSPAATHMAAITDSGTGTVYATIGMGS